jgi:hypothetical protein
VNRLRRIVAMLGSPLNERQAWAELHDAVVVHQGRLEDKDRARVAAIRSADRVFYLVAQRKSHAAK